MLKKLFFIGLLFSILFNNSYGQNDGAIKVGFLKSEIQIFPGEVVNLPVSIENPSENEIAIDIELEVPTGWKAIIGRRSETLRRGEKKILIFSLQSSAAAVVGDFQIIADIWDSATKVKIGSLSSIVQIKEYEDISMVLVQAQKHVMAGENLNALISVQNNGNTIKKVYLETSSCEIVGGNEVEVKPGQSVELTVVAKTNEDLIASNNAHISLRAVVGGKVFENVSHSYWVFPKESHKKDLFFRYPITASANYIYSNTTGEAESGYQFEAFGTGYLDTEKKHFFEFLARTPDNADLGYMGLYDQYYLTYHNDNVSVTVGEQSYRFTELTETSRFGMGVETQVKTNSGLKFGAIYVEPRYYEEIKSELAAYAGFEFDEDNWLDFYYISKNTNYTEDYVHLLSFRANVSPFKNSTLGFEVSGGQSDGKWDKAFRTNLSTKFSIFQLSGNYYFTGEEYPGYYSNSKFYSANVSARLSKKLSVGFYAKEDFKNAQLDTFFVTAPYSKSYQATLNYNLARKANLKFFWRNSERKDRLSTDEFHYVTESFNSQFTHRFKSFDYSLLGEYGKTTNYQLGETENEQNTYRLSGNFGYNIKNRHSFQLFGSWSNVNSFITDDQRNLTWGLSASSFLTKNLQAVLYLQNAYNIEDYYQNRNLMQASIDYTFLKNHKISLRSFYTLFKQETEDPDLMASVTYTYSLGVPLKQIIQAGDLTGTISYEDGSPAEGVILNVLNRREITKQNGEFSFTDLQPGMQLLYVDAEKFDIDEICNIPTPAQVEIIGNQEAILHLKITKGARFSGKFKVPEESELEKGSNIVIELKSEFDQFRIVSNNEGSFSFPLVRPGKYTFKIYTKSIPEGYSVKQTEYEFELKPGEKRELEVELLKKKRNIIFSSNNFVLTPINKAITETQEQESENPDLKAAGESFYTIQVGAFRKKRSNNSRYFDKYPFDFEKSSDGLYKYFIGKFNSLTEAKGQLAKVQKLYKNPFIVIFSGDQIAKPKATEYLVEDVFYSVQVGAFRFKKTNESSFFSAYPFEFERYSNNLNKYFVGRFTEVEDARALQAKLSQYYRNPFIVIFEKGKIKPVK